MPLSSAQRKFTPVLQCSWIYSRYRTQSQRGYSEDIPYNYQQPLTRTWSHTVPSTL